MDSLSKLPLPNTQFQEVLYELIKLRVISYENFNYMQGFRTRVSELREYLNIESENVTKVNKYGNSYTMKIHRLPENELQNAINLYLKFVD